jgi:hypothetical protein
MSDIRSRAIRTAASLPVGDPKRTQILAALAPQSKIAIKKDTETFIAWALQSNDRMSAGKVQRFVEKVTGREPIVPAAAPKPKRGPLEAGEKVIVDNYRNKNSLNTDACEDHHDQVGTVDSKSVDGLTVRFENNQTAYFEGHKSGNSTGLYRWTPKADYQEGAVGKKALIEMVYLRGSERPPPQRDIDALQEYVERGMAKGEHRSNIYYTGYVGKFAYNKSGEVYFTLSSQQRDRPTSINPAKGKVLYIGYAGRRPGGWKADAESMGLVV